MILDGVVSHSSLSRTDFCNGAHEPLDCVFGLLHWKLRHFRLLHPLVPLEEGAHGQYPIIYMIRKAEIVIRMSGNAFLLL